MTHIVCVAKRFRKIRFYTSIRNVRSIKMKSRRENNALRNSINQVFAVLCQKASDALAEYTFQEYKMT